MITKINIRNVASFDEQNHLMEGLGKVNFIFGTNGTGKSTISRVLSQPEADTYSDCVVSWENNVKECCKVFNTDFTKEAFSNVSGLPGIFTLGKDEGGVYTQIEAKKGEQKECTEKRKAILDKLNGSEASVGLKMELEALKQKYTDRLWKQKQKYASAKVSDGLSGFMNSKERFHDEIIRQYQENKSELLPYEQLEAKAGVVWGKDESEIVPINELNFSKVIALRQTPLLQKKIVGKEDVDVAALILKLGNSDWVKSGMTYLDASEDRCPFCQQRLDASFKKKVEEYFDESYYSSMREIRTLQGEHEKSAEQLKIALEAILQSNNSQLDCEALRPLVDEFINLCNENKRRLASKIKNPSIPTVLLDCTDCSERIKKIVREANEKISQHNQLVTNIRTERNLLTKLIWRFVSSEIKDVIADYLSQKQKIEDEISKYENKVREFESRENTLKTEVEELQKKLTSVIPTRETINRQLDGFGFSGFKLGEGVDEYTYSIVRDNGTTVGETLSEGERNFVSFLYFYSQIEGSLRSTGEIEPQVIVFDDPVSSMDSDVLFIVATLIRRLMVNMTEADSFVKQVIILTHNIYFHKEVSYQRNLPSSISKKMRFWVVRKCHGCSDISVPNENPIKSSYELLWREVRRAKVNPSCVEQSTLQNTMRRILEYYFEFLGEISLNGIPLELNGDERIVARSLLSWANDGSHGNIDDLYYTPTIANGIERYLSVFARIFDLMKQTNHYNMMMKIDNEETSNGEA